MGCVKPWLVFAMLVSVSNQGAVAVVTIDNPPVNAVGLAVRQGLMDALAQTEANHSVKAVVLACAGRSFIAGADVREFDRPLMEPHLPDVLAAIEAASKPWVAAIHGTALGGGLETAMACHHRVADKTAKLGLPEVTLGLIPGAGGTVRLPRLVDAQTALQMVAIGKPIGAAAGLAFGLIDEIAEGDLLTAAIALAQSAPAPVATLAKGPRLPEDVAAFEAQAAKIVAKAKGQIAPTAAIEALHRAFRLPSSEALGAERQAFFDLKAGSQSAALRHIFFAERATTKTPRIKGLDPRPIAQVGVVGGGTMGAGIAAACLLSGLAVQMVERDADAAQAGRNRVLQTLEAALRRGVITAEKHSEMIDRFAAAETYDALANADLIIEAVFEDLAVKHAVFAQLDQVAKPEAILATNTSYLDVAEIARATADPARVVGLHFFSPAHIMKLLEIVVPDGLADDVLATVVRFAKTLRKTAVLVGVCDGFVANRIMSAYRREAEYMIEDGALPWQVDAAMVAFGLPMGIFAMGDLAGLDISWAMRKRQAATRDPAQRYVDVGDKLCEMGRFGRKTGRGYYLYPEGEKPAPDPEVEALILAESARKGIVRIQMTDAEIMSRILDAMQREAQAILDEGIARSAADIDVVMVNAYGFPRWRGGPMFMAADAQDAPV